MIRRPIKARQTGWAAAVAARLVSWRVKPNWISMASVGWALLGALCFLAARHTGQVLRAVLFIAAAACVQLRLLCNLFDGMVAVEGGFKTASGEIYNDLPDRLADPLFLVAAGYAATQPWGMSLGWAASLAAVMTAYVRVLAGSTGATQAFMGPMAKQHRMAVLTIACVAAALESLWSYRGWALTAALGIVLIGAVITVLRRTCAAVKELEHDH